jgi:hypothetical protein
VFLIRGVRERWHNENLLEGMTDDYKGQWHCIRCDRSSSPSLSCKCQKPECERVLRAILELERAELLVDYLPDDFI